MRSPGGRPALALLPFACAALTLAVAACSLTAPQRTAIVAGRTEAPATATPTAPGPSDPSGSPAAAPEPTGGPSGTPGQTPEPGVVSAIVAGSVERTSLDLSAAYRVNAVITVRTGGLDVTTQIDVRNDSGAGIDRLELNTIAARLGGMRLTSTTVDDVPVDATVQDQTIVVPLGGILPASASATVRIAYRATLRPGTSGSDWMFTRSGGTLALYRWIPWVSRAMPFDRPNDGEPFVTPTSRQVDVEILTDDPMVLAAPAADVEEFAAGSGTAWSFTARDVRDVSVVLAPDFRVATGAAEGIPIRAYTRPGGLSAAQLAGLAAGAISAESDLLGIDYPFSALVVVETPGGVGLESPGLIWVPDDLDTRNRTYAVYQGTAHQWFYGLVGNDQRAEPFADEAPADLLARTALGNLRASRCGRDALDDPITAYSKGCYYEVIYVQGGLVLDELRRKMGTNRFWDALAGYVEAHRHGIAGTRQLLDALRAASPVDLLPVLRSRFPDLY